MGKLAKIGLIMMLFGLATPTLASYLQTGTYVTSGDSHYRDGTVSITSWADEFNMTAVLEKDGREYDVELNLRHVTGNKYRGSGFIYVRYSEDRGCRHRFAGVVYAYEGQLFLRENTPGHIPYNPDGPCTAAGPYEWFDHPESYDMQ